MGRCHRERNAAQRGLLQRPAAVGVQSRSSAAKPDAEAAFMHWAPESKEQRHWLGAAGSGITQWRSCAGGRTLLCGDCAPTWFAAEAGPTA